MLNPGNQILLNTKARALVPITELRRISGLIVYGYLRLPAPVNNARREALTWAIATYCDQHELVLGGMFTDDSRIAVLSPAFGGLLDVLTLDGSYGVVTPSLAHLGGRHLRSVRAELIGQTGRRLMPVRGGRETVAAR